MYHNTEIYFASANTACGFTSYFRKIFDPNTLEKIYILKGGPGTGKSSFLRFVAEIARKKEMNVEEFICSSDPESLDGIIIKELSTAIIDGTSPHTADPLYPGAVENIIDLGVFWDSKKLYESKKEIMELIHEKKRCYNRAYRFLKAHGEIEGEISRIGEKALLAEKMNHSLDRLMGKFFQNGSGFEFSVRLTTTANGHGICRLDTFIRQSNEIFVIEDLAHSAHQYLNALSEIVKNSEQKAVFSYSYLFPEKIDSIFFPEKKCTFIVGPRDYEKEISDKNYHYINMRRFLDHEVLKENKQKIRFGNRCSEMLLSGATESFSEAKRAHSLLERKYIEAMDFVEMTLFREKFTKELFA